MIYDRCEGDNKLYIFALHVISLDLSYCSKFGIILMGAQASEEEGEEGDDLLLLQPLSTPSASSIEAIGKLITSIESHPRGRENEIKYYEKCVDLDKEECLDLHRILFFISTKFSALSDKNLSNRNKMLKQRYAKHVCSTLILLFIVMGMISIVSAPRSFSTESSA